MSSVSPFVTCIIVRCIPSALSICYPSSSFDSPILQRQNIYLDAFSMLFLLDTSVTLLLLVLNMVEDYPKEKALNALYLSSEKILEDTMSVLFKIIVTGDHRRYHLECDAAKVQPLKHLNCLFKGSDIIANGFVLCGHL